MFKVSKIDNAFHITWKSNKISKTSYDKLSKWVKASRDYSEFNKKKLAALSKMSKPLGMTLPEAVSLRHIQTKDKH